LKAQGEAHGIFWYRILEFACEISGNPGCTSTINSIELWEFLEEIIKTLKVVVTKHLLNKEHVWDGDLLW
jgi:hypothetical protein